MKALPHPLAPELRMVSSRDLLWLICSLVLVIAPHALRAPWWLTLLTLCLYGWRLYLTLQRAPLPSRWLVLAVTAVALLALWIEFRTLFGRQPGILLLVMFSGLKLLETRTHRDAAVAAFLAYFLVITNFLYTQSILTAVLMTLSLLATTATLVGFAAPQRDPRANLRTASVLLAQAVPAALVLFLLFPRVQGPLWGLPQDAYTGMTGLSETMSPGSLSNLAQYDAIAFRAEFEGPAPLHALRYWRGPVLWDFDGRTWSIGPELRGTPPLPTEGRASYRYAVVLEPHNRPWLFALESVASVPERARLTFDGQILSTTPVRSRLRYDLLSVIAPEPPPSKPFDPADYGTMAEHVGVAADRLGGTVRDVSALLGTLDQKLPAVQKVLDETTARGKESIDHALRGALVVGIAIVVAWAVAAAAVRRVRPRAPAAPTA